LSAVAILHPTNLLGKELRETLEQRPEFGHDFRLLSTREDEIGTLTEVGGAAALVGRYEPEKLQGVRVAFLCGAIEDNRPVLADLPPDVTAIVCSYDATLDDGFPVVAGVNTDAGRGRRVLLSPHPAVVLLASLLDSLRDLQPAEVAATVIQPVSMRDDAGLEELFEQTRQIVAMTRRTPTPVFGAQLAFNVLPAVLPADPLAAQVGAVLPGLPPLALQLLQGAVFHSVAASLYVRVAGGADAKEIRRALAGHVHMEAAGKPKHLGPVDSAASDKVLFGSVRKDEATGGFWLWAVMDNLTRGGALNALEIAETV
jgi:aspartate-semialdehyde dehydrogenase